MSAPVVASVHPGRGRLALRCMVLLALLVSVWGGAGTALAATRGETKVVRYRGYSVVVPAGWPVYNLAASPTVCVRLTGMLFTSGCRGPRSVARRIRWGERRRF